jgi:predicted lipoprotein
MRLNKYIKYSLLLVVVALLAYKSVYFKKLSEVKAGITEKFDAVVFTRKLWDEKLPVKLDSAVELTTLIKAITADPNAAFEKYTNAMAVGNYRYAMVKTAGEVVQVNEDDLLLQLPFADSLLNVKVATEFVYGNAIRDASKLLQTKDFSNTTDLSNISEELNKTVRTVVLAPFKKVVKKGDKLAVTGAIEINKAHINWNEPEIIPVRLQIKN